MDSDFVFSDDFNVNYKFDSNLQDLMAENQTVFVLSHSSKLEDLIGDAANDFVNDFTGS